MSDTPRTDAAIAAVKHWADVPAVVADESRTLERELAAVTARAESAERDALQRAAEVAAKHAQVCYINGFERQGEAATTIHEIILALIPKERT